MKANDIESITNDNNQTIINLVGKSPLIIKDENSIIYESLFGVDEQEFNAIINKTQEDEIKN